MPELASVENKSLSENDSIALDGIAALLKERLTTSSPACLVQAEAYKKDDVTKPGASRTERQISLKHLTNPLMKSYQDYGVEDIFLSLVSIYLNRVSGEGTNKGFFKG